MLKEILLLISTKNMDALKHINVDIWDWIVFMLIFFIGMAIHYYGLLKET